MSHAHRSPDAHRELVSQVYGALAASQSSCCAPASSEESGCCGPTTTSAARSLGYDEIDLKLLGDDVVTFGCGNPVAFADVQPGDTVLDLGSGGGLDLVVAARATGATGRVIGVDMTDQMIALATKTAKNAGFQDVIEVRQGTIEALPVASGTVNRVVSNCVVNLSPEKDKVFGEIYRVLAPGGTVSISDMVVKDAPPWVTSSAAAVCACVGGAIEEDRYLQGLNDAGLVDVQVEHRRIFSADEIRELIRTELPALADVPDSVVEQALAALDGKVYSARFSARKPTA